VALLDRRVVVQRRARDPRLLRHRVHERDVARRQPHEGRALFRDVRHLSRGPSLLGLRDQALVVKLVQQAQEHVRRRQPADEPHQPLVRAQHLDVVEALAARRHQQHQRLDLLGIGRSAVATADQERPVQRVRQAHRAHGLDHQRQARARRQGRVVGNHLDRVGQDAGLGRHRLVFRHDHRNPRKEIRTPPRNA
jgi:hypothetical protein